MTDLDSRQMERELAGYFYEGRPIFESISSLDETKFDPLKPFLVWDAVTQHYQHYIMELNSMHEEDDPASMKYTPMPGPFFRPTRDARDALEMGEVLGKEGWKPFLAFVGEEWVAMFSKGGKEYVGKGDVCWAICNAAREVIHAVSNQVERAVPDAE